MKKSPILAFQSSKFLPVPGEDEATNPGVFGKALAEWLGAQLHLVGVAAGNVIPEDFGWVIPVTSEQHSLYVACSNGEAPNGWRVFALAEGGLVARVFGIDKSGPNVDSLYASVRRCLEIEQSVTGLREQTED